MADKRAGEGADRGWIVRVATAAGAAAGAGAAQLGLGYGLGVVVWPATVTADDSVWLGSLGWATWTAASATVFGALIGSRVRGGPGPRTTAAWRFALSACAALGALVAVALVALPARSAVRPDTAHPEVIAAGYAAIGLFLGLIVAFWATSSTPVAVNLIATTVWLWALAIAAVIVDLATTRTSATYLTSWQFAEVASTGRYGTIYWPSALMTLTAAFLIGALAAAPATRRGDLGAAAATSGAAGPLLVAFAFLALAPRLTGALGPIESAYLIAPYAVLTGLAGSALVVAAARSAQDRRARRESQSPVPAREARSNVPAREARSGVAERETQSNVPASAPTRPAGVSAAVPAAPASQPPKARPGLFGRSKVPAQPSTPTTDQSPKSPGRRTTERPSAEPSTPERPATQHPAAERPKVAAVPADIPPAKPTAAKPTAAKPTAAKPTPAKSNADEDTAEVKPVVTDPEIAAAARPSRPTPRPKKAAPKSTVTPPPPAPSVAQINPKPPAETS
ncbi:Hansenula MRAKII killer toxin-resistant protein 1 [Paractinoplanes deccanensis]|nr:Hansenula MRAKII killer toxin-resistant protein 1 [Actinoplanes deccanensis]